MPARPSAAPIQMPAQDRAGMYQIGEVAERVGLSLRTVRYYEEVGLLSPVARTQGHFRLFTDQDIERLLVIKQMKPSGFSLDQMRELLDIRDRLRQAQSAPQQRAELIEKLEAFAVLSVENAERLRRHLAFAEQLVVTLDQELRAERGDG